MNPENLTRSHRLNAQAEPATGARAHADGSAPGLDAEPATPASAGDGFFQAHTLIGESPLIVSLRHEIDQCANSPFPVLIEGESGSGKEIVAALLHSRSIRQKRPALALNCAALSPALLEPALFGHARGAFTGATMARSGYFEDTADGTLFLDEIGELSLDLQPKLLRVLESGEFQRVGETRSNNSRARIVAATNRDLRHEVKHGRFRADLYHRLSVLRLQVPPLRECADDRGLLLAHFLKRQEIESGVLPFHLDEDALALWREYDFPGNVRELRNIVIRLSARHAGAKVSSAMLAPELDQHAVDGAHDPTCTPPASDPESLSARARSQLARGESFSLDALLHCVEQGYIKAAMQLASGNVSHAARMLGINRTTLYSRMDARQRASSPG